MAEAPPAEKDPHAWMLNAERKLKRADAQFAEKIYGDAMSDLQASEERLAKAILLRMSILPIDPNVAALMTIAFPGLKYTVPEKLSHNWHEKLLEDFVPYLNSFEKVGELFGNEARGGRTKRFWRSAIPDYLGGYSITRPPRDRGYIMLASRLAFIANNISQIDNPRVKKAVQTQVQLTLDFISIIN